MRKETATADPHAQPTPGSMAWLAEAAAELAAAPSLPALHARLQQALDALLGAGQAAAHLADAPPFASLTPPPAALPLSVGEPIVGWILPATPPTAEAGAALQVLAALTAGAYAPIAARAASPPALVHAEGSPEQAVRDHYLALVSHELRTPLYTILGYAELLRDTPLSAEATGYVDRLLQGGRHLLNLVDELLRAKALSSQPEPLEPIAIDPLIAEVTGALTASCAVKGLELQVEQAPGLPSVMVGHRDSLRAALTQLGAFCIQNTEHGHVRLAVAVGTGEAGSQLWRLSWSDSGRGFSSAEAEGLFLPSRGNVEARRLGLGPITANRLVERMGGQLTLVTRPGGGSTLVISLPAPPSALPG